MSDNNNQTYDFICFTDLAYEFSAADQKKIENKIKRRLKYHKLGAYDQERVAYIRRLKDDLSSEISHPAKSKYYQKSNSEFSALDDFDRLRMTAEFNLKYPVINKNELMAMIDFAIYLLYLR